MVFLAEAQAQQQTLAGRGEAQRLMQVGVVEAAVVADPCPVLGERVHAFVVAGAGVRPAELRCHCAGLLADYKVPEDFTMSAEPLPRNANGKLLKRALRPRRDRES